MATGAQLFDSWFMKQATRDRDGVLRARRPARHDARSCCSPAPPASFPNRAPRWRSCGEWIAALRASGDPTLRDINVLVRPHPYNCHAWDPDPLADLPGAVFFPRRGYNPIDPDNRADFFDSIYHSAAVVGINTSAMIEAAIIGRPVFSMLAEEFAGTQEGTIHFHHLLPENGGCVRIASTIDEHVRQLSDRLRDPEGARAETQRFIGSFIRPARHRPAGDADLRRRGRAAGRRAGAAAAARAGRGATCLRPLVLAAAVPGGIAGWLSRPDPLKPLRKRWHQSTYRRRRPHRSGGRSRWSSRCARGGGHPDGCICPCCSASPRFSPDAGQRSVSPRSSAPFASWARPSATGRRRLEARLSELVADGARTADRQGSSRAAAGAARCRRAADRLTGSCSTTIDQIAARSRPAAHRPVDRGSGVRAALLDSVRRVGAGPLAPCAGARSDRLARRRGVVVRTQCRRSMSTFFALFERRRVPRAVAEEKRKHRRPGRVRRACDRGGRHGIAGSAEIDVLHPGLMYRAFAPYWSDEAGYALINQFTRHGCWIRPRRRCRQALPADYVAVRFYFSECFPATRGEPAFARSVVVVARRAHRRSSC